MAEKENNLTTLIKVTSDLLKTIYLDIAQPSLQAIGQALGTVLEVLPTSLLSVKYWNEKRKLNFKKHINDYINKIEVIPEEKRCEVDIQIGYPIIEKLTYTTNDEIADLFTTLLANASNIDTINRAHPAFIEIISRLSPDEARIIKHIRGEEYIPFCEIRGTRDHNIEVIESHLTLIQYEIPLRFPTNMGIYLSNLASVGIIELNHDFLVQITTTEYDEMCKSYELDKIKQNLVPSKFDNIVAKRMFYIITPFGRLFIKACIK